MPEVPAIATPLLPEGLLDALRGGHVSWFGELPSYNRLGVAWSQCALETAEGGATWCYNVGNLKCFEACQQEHSYCRIPTSTPGEYVYQAAYVGPVEGARSYWRMLEKTYPQALPKFDAGKPYEAAYALYNGGHYPSYFQAPPEGYARAMSAFFTQYLAKWPRSQYDPQQPYDSETVAERHGGLIVAAGAVVAAATAWYVLTRKESIA